MSELTRKKNEASEIMFAMVDSTTPANLKSGLTVTDTPYYKDGAGAWAALSIADAATEIGTTGMYTIEMIAAELNHDLILIKLTSTGAADTIVVIRTTTHDIDDVNIVVPDAAGVAPTAAEIKTEIEQAGSSIASILEDTGDLQTNQGAWATATGFSTHNAADVKTAIEAAGSHLALILADTGELQTNQGNWLTATGFSTHNAAAVWSVATRILTASTNFNDLTAAEMKAEVVAALADIKLDHLINIAVDTDWATTVHLDSVIGHLADVGTSATFNRTTDALEALRVHGDSVYDRIGAPVGASIAADLVTIDDFVDELESRLTAVRAGYLDNISAGAVALASVCTEARLAELDAANLPADIDLILADTNELQTDWYDGGRLDRILDTIGFETLLWRDIGQITVNEINTIVDCTGGKLIFIDDASNLFRSDDYGETWTEIAAGAAFGYVQHGILYLGNNTLVIGDYDGHIWKSTDLGATWLNVATITGSIHDMVVCGDGSIIAGGYTGHIWKSTDLGETWIDKGAIASSVIDCIEVTGENTVTCGTYHGKIYFSSDNGETWTFTGAILPDSIHLILSDGAGVAIVSACNGAMWRSDDYGKTWNDLLISVGGPTGAAAQAGVAINKSFVLISYTGWRSDDCGKTWKDQSIPTEEAMAMILADNNHIIVGDPYGHVFITVAEFATGIAALIATAQADITTLALEASLNDIKGTGFVKDTHSLPQCLTATGFSIPNEYDTVITSLQTDLDNPSQYKADVSALATTTALSTAQTDLDTITGSDGVTLATQQLNYAPNTVIPDAMGTAAGLHTTTDGKVDALQTDTTTIKTKTDNLPSGLAKNVAVPKFDVFMVLAGDHVAGATGKTVTGTISKDGGAFVALTNPITEVDAGMYTIADGLTQEERNADVSTLKFSADGCDDRIITIISS